MHHRPHSFDTRGLKFAALFLIVLLVVCAVVKYGTASAARYLAAAAFAGSTDAELQLLEAKARRDARSAGEIHVLGKLHAYEDALATHASDTAAAGLLARAQERFVAADISTMKLYLFEDGFATSIFDIVSIGPRGFPEETPTGLFALEAKEEQLSRADSPVPHTLRFFGDFFVHDSSQLPGIKLSANDAATVYAFASEGTPIFVTRSLGTPQTIATRQQSLPRVSARAFLVADAHTGTIYAEKNSETAYPIASISKLLIALVASETIPHDQTVTVSAADRALTEGTPGSIAAFDSFAALDLLYALLMESNNSVAYALAHHHGSALVRMMNDKAQAIGMVDTVMEEPSGLSPRNVASARDLFTLARHIYNNQSYLLNITRLPQKTITAVDGSNYALHNLNHFAGNTHFLGGKTGYTDEARQTMVTLFDVPIDTTTATISIVVLGSENRKEDIEALLAWFKSAAIEVAGLSS